MGEPGRWVDMKNGAVTFAKVTLMPGLFPRVGKLFFSGFGHIAYFMARAYAALRLLPPNHPYLNPDNYGRFGILHVMGEARQHLKFDRYHMDQVILYFTLMIGFVLLIAQFILMLVTVGARSAFAAPVTPAALGQFFVTPTPNTDLAFRLLDLVFGFPNIFNSCVTAPPACTPPVTPNPAFYNAMHTLFQFYNVGLLFVAAVIFLYLMVAVIAETAQSGEPFGQRFNGAWAPLRMIWAVAMLCPLTFGMNGAQLVTLHVAKWGSSLATNTWNLFLTTVAPDTPLGQPAALVAVPRGPSVSALVQFIFVARTCSHFEKLMHDRNIGGYIVVNNRALQFLSYDGMVTMATFNAARAFTGNQNMEIRFGDQSPDYTDQQGNVRPICGQMTLPITDVTQPGALLMEQANYYRITEFWNDPMDNQVARNLVIREIPNELRNPTVELSPFGNNTLADFVRQSFMTFDAQEANDVDLAREAQINNGNWNENFAELGWAGAAIWYNKLAEMNGGLMTAVYNQAKPSKYPELMETVSGQRRQGNQQVDPQERFKPVLPNGKPFFTNPEDQVAAGIYYKALQIWRSDTSTAQNITIVDTIKSIFGLEGLFSMRENITAGVTPLAVLVGLGRGLVESAIGELGFSLFSMVGGGIANLLGLAPIATIGMGLSKFVVNIGMLSIGIGVILFYVIPFLPFLYFMFSAGTWVKSLVQALVAMPLWAISHITIDGEGLPGRLAMDGYFLLFEVFVRPVLMVFGLLGGLLIFNAEASILNEVWDLVTDNLTGFVHQGAPAAAGGMGTTTGSDMGSIAGMRGAVDTLMYTVLYAVVMYMMALSSFKMSDAVPDNIIRWLGASIESFGKSDPNPAEGLVGRISTAVTFLSSATNPILGLVGRNR